MNSETMPSSNALRGCCAEFVSSGMLAATEHSFQTTSTREQGGRLDAQCCAVWLVRGEVSHSSAVATDENGDSIIVAARFAPSCEALVA